MVVNVFAATAGFAVDLQIRKTCCRNGNTIKVGLANDI